MHLLENIVSCTHFMHTLLVPLQLHNDICRSKWEKKSVFLNEDTFLIVLGQQWGALANEINSLLVLSFHAIF